MQPRSLQSILSELSSSYDPQIKSLRQRQTLIPQQIADEEKGLRAQEQDYYDNTIMSDARRRGIGFGGIPIGERARYGATQFLPALARARQSGREQALNLEDAILGVQERRNTTAQQMRQGDLSRYDQNRQFNANMKLQREQMAAQERQAAAARSMAAQQAIPRMDGNNQQPNAGFPKGMTPRSNALGNFTGFNFVGKNKKPVSAVVFAAQNKIPIGELLYEMGSSGDPMAKSAYNWVKSIQGSDLWNSGQWKNTPAYTQTFAPIFWGS